MGAELGEASVHWGPIQQDLGKPRTFVGVLCGGQGNWPQKQPPLPGTLFGQYILSCPLLGTAETIPGPVWQGPASCQHTSLPRAKPAKAGSHDSADQPARQVRANTTDASTGVVTCVGSAILLMFLVAFSPPPSNPSLWLYLSVMA
jgi:hypothetical protein